MHAGSIPAQASKSFDPEPPFGSTLRGPIAIDPYPRYAGLALGAARKTTGPYLNGFDADQLIEDLRLAAGAEARFTVLTEGLGKLGLDIVNYGFFDAQAAELVRADIQFMSTMRDDWMTYYYDSALGETDVHVQRVVAGKITPYTWMESDMRRLDAKAERKTALEGAEAGLRSALCVPLASPLDPFSPVAGITLGSSMNEADFRKVTAEHGATLLSIAYLFHNASIRQVWRERAGGKRLSNRERDCLSHLADGKRHDAIAHLLGLARVTVEAHLTSGRRKLGARTLNEAVAKALLFGEISRG